MTSKKLHVVPSKSRWWRNVADALKGSRSRKRQRTDTDTPLFRKKTGSSGMCTAWTETVAAAEVEAQGRRCCCCSSLRIRRYNDHGRNFTSAPTVSCFTSSHRAALGPQIQFSHSTLQIISIIPPKIWTHPKRFRLHLYIWLLVEGS